jgi:hypothetical protein
MNQDTSGQELQCGSCHTFKARDQFVNPKNRSVPTKNCESCRARNRDRVSIPTSIIAL